MCGIGGYIGDPAGIDEEALLARLRHRGPDHLGRRRLQALDGTPVFLGFARLSILDLSAAGHQPMSTEDDAQTLLYNGETYNFRELRQDLAGRGHSFRSTSDTEVVLRGYREWGEGVVERMRGMFAFALWDAPRQRLVLGRDRIGVKPLYYHYDGRRLVFASELRAILHCGAVPARLDPRAVHGYLALGSVPQPRTILKDVALLLPGHLLTVQVEGGRPRQVTERRYFSVPAPARGPSSSGTGRDDAVAAVAPVLAEAVAARLVADVPVGVLLSGGIDSTAVAVLATRAAAQLETFTLTYGAEHRESEGEEADEVARALGTRHHERVETPESILPRVPAYLAAVDQPSADGFNTYLVAGLVRERGRKVALTGLGGDEVFLGYPLRHHFAAALRAGGLISRLPGLPSIEAGDRLLGRAPVWAQKGAALLRASARQRAHRAIGLYAVLRGMFPAAHLYRLLDPDLGLGGLDPAAHVRCDLPAPALLSLPPDELLSYLEIGNYLANTLLRDADVMSMVHGVELRVPLCDHLLISRVMGLYPGARIVRGRLKPLLVDAARSPLLDRVARRRKRGFVLPLSYWLRHQLAAAVDPVLGDAGLSRAAGLVPGEVSRLWREFQAGRAPRATWRVWALYTLLSWVRQHGASL